MNRLSVLIKKSEIDIKHMSVLDMAILHYLEQWGFYF